MSFFCKHKWKVLVEATTESPFEVAMRAVLKNAVEISIPHQMSRTDRKHITILACEKCGVTKKYVEVLL